MRPNNFDLIRLLAALQVVYCHSIEHLNITTGMGDPILAHMIRWFPGVPIFFTVSGFLISRSWERSNHWTTYATNRLIRIYPALWVSFGATLVLAALFGFVTPRVITSNTFISWVMAQLSFLQFYNPEFLRGFGLGSINGSLWTIPVELGFYVLLPLLYLGILNRSNGKTGNFVLIGLATASFAYFYILTRVTQSENIFVKLQMVTPLPHLYMFLFGILLQRNFVTVLPLIEDNAWKWLSALVAFNVIADLVETKFEGFDAITLMLTRVILGVTVISAAFSWRELSERALNGNDLSYGVYLYHMLAINTLVHLNYSESSWLLIFVFLVSLACAVFSWLVVESPFLLKKPHRTQAPDETVVLTP